MLERVSIHVKDELEDRALHPVISEIMDSHFDPGYRQRWFAHDPWHLWYILDGRAVVGVAGEEFDAGEGDLFLIPGGVLHYLEIPGPGSCRIFDAKFDFVSDISDSPGSGYLRDRFGVRHLIDRIVIELNRRAPAWETAVRGLFNEVVGEVFRRFSLPETEVPWPEAVHRAVEYIEANFHRPIQLEDVADHVAFSPKYLAVLFKRATGYSVKEYVTFVRIERAKWYLTHSNLSVKEVSLRTGYSSIHYFSRLFHTTVGVPATVFRRNHQFASDCEATRRN